MASRVGSTCRYLRAGLDILNMTLVRRLPRLVFIRRRPADYAGNIIMLGAGCYDEIGTALRWREQHTLLGGRSRRGRAIGLSPVTLLHHAGRFIPPMRLSICITYATLY